MSVLNKWVIGEQYYVLQKGSVVNGLKFPLWNEEDPGSKSTLLYEYVALYIFEIKSLRCC